MTAPPSADPHSAAASAPSSAPASEGGGGGGDRGGDVPIGRRASSGNGGGHASPGFGGGGGRSTPPARNGGGPATGPPKAVSFGSMGAAAAAAEAATIARASGAAGSGAAAPAAGGASRLMKPGAGLTASTLGLRRWVRIDDGGAVSSVVADKHALTQALGVQPRDLRLLDPHLATSYPTAILCRDKALVVNLEHIKAVITASHVLVLNADDGAVGAFIEELSRRVGGSGAGGVGSAATSTSGDVGGGAHATAAGAPLPRGGLAASLSAPDLAGRLAGGGGTGPPSSASGSAAAAPPGGRRAAASDGSHLGPTTPRYPAARGGGAAAQPPALGAVAPFELRALEVALEGVCAHLEALAGDLEAAAHPALDDLTAAVTTPNLERVRRVKSRLVRLTTRVETLREVLEKLLDDDADMHDMNLTARAAAAADRERGHAAAQQPGTSPSAVALSGSAGSAGGAGPFGSVSGSPHAVPPLVGSAGGGGGGEVPSASALGSAGAAGDLPGPPSFDVAAVPAATTPGAAALAAAMRHAGLDPAASVPAALEFLEEEKERDEGEIAEVEMVLEAYFMQVDATFNRLQTLCEYIDDTEDYINIELDNHRNQLIRLELMLTAATFAVALVGAVSGIFGMNLHNRAEDSYAAFVATSVVSSVGAVLCFLGIVAYCKKRGLF